MTEPGGRASVCSPATAAKRSEKGKRLMKHADIIKSIFAAVAFCAALPLVAETETVDGIDYSLEV